MNNFSLDYAIGGGEDLDMCFQLFEAGLDVYVDHRVFIYHEWGSTGLRILGAERRREQYEAGYRTFLDKWSRYAHRYTKQPPGYVQSVTTALMQLVAAIAKRQPSG